MGLLAGCFSKADATDTCLCLFGDTTTVTKEINTNICVLSPSVECDPDGLLDQMDEAVCDSRREASITSELASLTVSPISASSRPVPETEQTHTEQFRKGKHGPSEKCGKLHFSGSGQPV